MVWLDLPLQAGKLWCRGALSYLYLTVKQNNKICHEEISCLRI